MSDFTLEELEQEAERRKKERGSDEGVFTKIGRGFVKGSSAGAAGLLSLPADIPAAALNAAGVDVPIPGQAWKESAGVAEPPTDPVERAAYNYGEGFTPAAGLGMVGGPAAAAVAGTVGGALNMAGKAFFPLSPALQALVNMLPLGVSVARQIGRNLMPTGKPKMVTDPETGTPLTPGQASENIEQLSKEEAMRRNVKTNPIATQAYEAQNQHITNFFKNVQKTAEKADIDPEIVYPKLYKAFENKNDTMITSFKQRNNRNFTAASAAGRGQPVIPMDGVLRKVNQLIANFDNPEIPGFSAMSSSWKRIKDAYLEEVSDPGSLILGANGQQAIPASTSIVKNNVTIERLQQNLAAWADAAKTGSYAVPGKAGNMFEGVAPGQVKGFARQMLNAYREDMDTAIAKGVPGAAQLKFARDEFKNGLQEIEQWAAHPVVKNMSVEQITALEPEKVVKMFTELPNSQRLVAASAIKAQDPQAWEQIRVMSFRNYLKDAIDPKTKAFDPEKALTVFNKIPEKDLEYLLPTQAEKADFKSGMAVVEKLNKSKDYVKLDDEQLVKALDEISSLAGAIYGAKGRYVTKLTLDTLRNLAGRPQTVEQAAFMAFNPDGRALARAALSNKLDLNDIPKGSVEKYIQLSKFGRRVALPVAVSGATGAGIQKEQDPEMARLINEAQRRGLQVQ